MPSANSVRQLLDQHGQLVMPGVYDALSAKIAARAGFEVVFITGYSLSATLLGEPDFGLLTQTEVVNAATRICAVTRHARNCRRRYGVWKRHKCHPDRRRPYPRRRGGNVS